MSSSRLGHEAPGSILVVEDDASVRRLLVVTLELAGHRIVDVESGERALLTGAKNEFDVVMLDQGLPGMDGTAVLRGLRELPHLQNTRFLVLSGSAQREALVAMLRAGAHDYVHKPFEPPELLARVDACLRSKRELDALVAAAMHDPVTGLLNRRGGEQELFRCQAHSRRTGKGLAVLMVDLVGFKAVNDTYGHGVGDNVLQHVSAALTAALRQSDALCRWGGDEFLAILPITGLYGAQTLAERCASEVRDRPLRLDGVSTIELAITVGAAATTTDRDDPLFERELEDLAARADEALYLQRRRRL